MARTIEDEIRSTRSSWKEVKEIAGDSNAWLHGCPMLHKELRDFMMMMMMMISQI